MANDTTPRPGGTTVGTPAATGTGGGTGSTGGIGGGPATRRPYEDLMIAEDAEAWRARTRIVLMPTAPPSIMGLMGFTIATLMLGSWQAGWWGTGSSPLGFWPLALVAGGILQSIAAVVSFRARDGAAVAVHTAWGAFWIAWGIVELLVALHVTAPVALGSTAPAFAIWFVGLAIVTLSGFLAALAQSVLLTITTGTLAAGAALTAVGFFTGSLGLDYTGGWLFVVAAAAAWVTATAMILEGATGRTIIPLGKWKKNANIPGRMATVPMQYPEGMPGSRVGQ